MDDNITPRPRRIRRLVDLSEAAYELGLSQRTVRRYVHHGDLPAVRLGDGPRAPIRLRRRDLDAFVDEHLMPATSEEPAQEEALQ
jgi:excisionase family DNA binding protein